MYAVVTTGGKQYRVEAGSELIVERLAAEPGASITFDRVLLVGDGEAVTVGTPTVDGASVSGTVIGEELGPKLIIFKFKQKVKYRRTSGSSPAPDPRADRRDQRRRRAREARGGGGCTGAPRRSPHRRHRPRRRRRPSRLGRARRPPRRPKEAADRRRRSQQRREAPGGEARPRDAAARAKKAEAEE